MEGFIGLIGVIAYTGKLTHQDMIGKIDPILTYNRKAKVFRKDGVEGHFTGNWDSENEYKGFIFAVREWVQIEAFVNVMNALTKILPENTQSITYTASVTSVLPEGGKIGAVVNEFTEAPITHIRKLNGVVEYKDQFYIYLLDINKDKVRLSLSDDLKGELSISAAVNLAEKSRNLLTSYIKM